jgi:hypothetical protein
MIASGAGFWVDGSGSSVSSSIGTVDLEDPEGTYDFLLKIRNAPISLASIAGDDASLDLATPEGTMILDHVATAGDQRKQLILNDPIAALLDLPFQNAYFLPNVDAAVANTPLPVSLGGPRNFTPVLYNAAGREYGMADRPIGYLGTLRVQGKPIAYPTDFSLTADQKGVILAADPAGKFTGELSSVYAGPSPSPTDVLAGTGLFNTFTTNTQVDANWSRDSTNIDVPTLITTAGYGQVKYPHGPQGNVRSLLSLTNVIANNTAYEIQIAIDFFPGFTIGAVSQPYASYFYIDGTEIGIVPQQGWSGAYYSIYPTAAGGLNVHAPALLKIRFANNSGAALPLALRWICNNGTQNFLLKSVVLYELPSVTANTPLTGLSLEAYMREIFTRSGKIDETQWASEDAAAIDTATGYQISNGFYNGVVTIRNALLPGLESFTASTFRRQDGRIGVTRLIDPDSVSAVGDIKLADILSEPEVAIYPAIGLTTNAEGRRNHSPYTDSDFSGVSTSDVPLAERVILEKDYQFTINSGVQLDEMYAQAVLADPRPTLFDLEADAQAENDRVASIFTVPRNTYSFMVSAPQGNDYEIGDVRTLSYGKYADGVFVPRYGLDSAKVLILKIERYTVLQKARLTVFR